MELSVSKIDLPLYTLIPIHKSSEIILPYLQNCDHTNVLLMTCCLSLSSDRMKTLKLIKLMWFNINSTVFVITYITGRCGYCDKSGMLFTPEEVSLIFICSK